VQVGDGPDEEQQEHGISGGGAEERDAAGELGIGEMNEPLGIGAFLRPGIFVIGQGRYLPMLVPTPARSL
jgi:hypothetical protein